MRLFLAVSLTLAVAAAPLSEDARIGHALDRLTFGARPGDLDRVRTTGLKNWIDLQLHPDKIAENPVLEQKLQPLRTIAPDYQLPTPDRTLGKDAKRQMKKQTRQSFRAIDDDLLSAKLYRAVYSTRQLAEVLTDFWYNHFNVYQKKGPTRVMVTAYERDAIRPHVLGKFKDMLLATAQSPAMLVYLDNFRSVAPGINRGKKARVLNENYGRELMELHTMGVDGGYTQKDVTEVARCFTGWTVRQPRAGGDFAFNRRMHDNGEKVVLGVRIPPGGGVNDGLKVLDILARHPATAQFISKKLAVRFVSDNPSPELVNRMAMTFTKSSGDIREVVAVMLASPEFWSEKNYRTKMKSPFETVVSAVRALNVEVESAAALAARVAEAGQPLYRKQEPTGYSNSSEEWANTSALLARMNFGIALVENSIPGLSPPDPKILASLKGDPKLYLGGPEFQRK